MDIVAPLGKRRTETIRGEGKSEPIVKARKRRTELDESMFIPPVDRWLPLLVEPQKGTEERIRASQGSKVWSVMLLEVPFMHPVVKVIARHRCRMSLPSPLCLPVVSLPSIPLFSRHHRRGVTILSTVLDTSQLSWRLCHRDLFLSSSADLSIDFMVVSSDRSLLSSRRSDR